MARVKTDLALRMVQKQLQEKNRELEERELAVRALLDASNRELKGFSRSISHDIRSPLRGINGYSLR